MSVRSIQFYTTTRTTFTKYSYLVSRSTMSVLTRCHNRVLKIWFQPPDGFATHTKPAKKDAVDFIIETIHRFPHEVTILEIAPPTNMALAIRKDPTIVPLIKQIVTMAGQIFVPGNAYLDNAEFNWWFDPDATQIVLRAAVPHFIIPLDCTNNVPLTQAVFNQIATHQPQTIITKLFAQAFGPSVGPWDVYLRY